MTRETKIGLLLGMGVILLIGIIISDHLSGVQQQAPADFTDFGAEAQRSIESSDALPGRQVAQPSQPPERTSPVIEAPSNFFIPDTQDDTAVIQARQAMANPTENDSAEAPAKNRNAPTHLLLRSQGDVPTVTVGGMPAALPHTLGPAITSPQPAVGPGIRHTVLSGETLFKIAERYYGNGEYWRAIAQANPGSVTQEGLVRQGVVLDIPKRADSRLGSDFIPVGSEKLTQIDTRKTARRVPVIEVVAGDTLSELATKHLGSAARWQDLLKANKDKLDGPQSLQIGMKLRLPGTTVQQQAATPTINGPASKPRTGKTYTVRAGDNLTQIAQRTMGDGDKWQEVYKANRDTLKSPDRLTVGQELKIPG
jgi:nucleoid-associated protein YgaU